MVKGQHELFISPSRARRRRYCREDSAKDSYISSNKDSVFGCDPNWGRIIAAAGDANVPVQPAKVEIILREVLARDGMEVPFDEDKLKKLMNKKELELIVNLHDGKTSYDIYTTDLNLRLRQDQCIVQKLDEALPRSPWRGKAG